MSDSEVSDGPDDLRDMDSAPWLQHAALQIRWIEHILDLPRLDGSVLADLFRGLNRRTEQVAAIQARYYRDHLELWSRMLDAEDQSRAAVSVSHDRRFDSPDWSSLPFFRFVRDSYLLNARWANEVVDQADIDPTRKHRIVFVLRQWIDALSPVNFAATNPEVIRLAVQTGGASLKVGLDHLHADLERGRIQMTDERAFVVGETLAATSGAVILENPIAQVIQYHPRTPRVHALPLLIVPPFINKYYVLDLQPQNSFVRFALDQGLQVFIISWRNPPAELGTATWDDYVEHGVLAPLAATLQIAAAQQANMLGFCVGGTLLSTTLAVMPAAERVASLTLLATMLDFSDVGDIGVYIDEEFARRCEVEFASGGVMPGGRLAAAFASLRANQLIWPFVVDNYLKGLTPKPFDLLHWNADGADLPGTLYSWYVRHLYLENRLRVPGKLNVRNVPVDLGRIRQPAYVLGAREDHIVPWHTAYASAQLLPGTIDFVLASSGHIAGVVNPPGLRRREYWLGGAPDVTADDWLARARRSAGSWWPHWAAWLSARSGHMVAAPLALGDVSHPTIEAAPGRYVRERTR